MCKSRETLLTERRKRGKMKPLMYESIEDYYYALEGIEDEELDISYSDILLLAEDYADNDLIDAFLASE